jgi:hypothetical protein
MSAPTGSLPLPPPPKTPGGSGTQPTNSVPAPKFGGYYPGSSSIVWVGGPPLADFSASYLTTYKTPLAIRGLSPAEEIKGYSKRVVQSCPKEFKRDDSSFPLHAFASEALTHMRINGMDTVFYMKGVNSNGEGGVELFTYHSRYSKAQVAQITATRMADGTYDYYAQVCLEESALWLINSLDESLLKYLRTRLTAQPTGPEVWMMIVAEVQTASMRRWSQLINKFKSLSLAKFKGENVREYVEVADEILTDLEKDNQLPPNHLTDIVDHMSACTVMDFKIHWKTQGKHQT